jgi:cellulose synthase/poly-beta-1,6-N-acetylglucosamine synthase-like glycosyltransferase
MQNIIEIILFIALIIIFYAYFGYPISLYILNYFISKNIKKSEYYPRISIIIAAHNEEILIRDKIDNTLAIIYSRDKLQIIIVSDGSNDGTNDIVSGYKERGIELLAIPARGGKENAQKEAIKKAEGDIFIFTDVATILDPLAVMQIVSNFSDPEIGCVSGEDRMISEDGKQGGEGYYVRYEMWLRKLESKVNSLVGLSGSFFAARKTVCQDFSSHLDSDFRTLLNSVKNGLRGISDPMAVGYYRGISDQRREFERKVRTVLRGITVFFNSVEYLNFFKYGIFSYQYFCHKLLRWLVPLFLLIAFMANIILSFYSWTYFAILVIIIINITILIFERMGVISNTPKILYLPIYFFSVNLSIIIAWYRYFRHERIVIWNPTVRL